MDAEQNIRTIAIIGGTGALGTGLARRWARAGYAVVIGSRTAPKAEAAAAELLALVPDAQVSGTDNLAAATAADIAVVTVPFAHQQPTLEAIRPGLAGKILVETTVPLVPPKVARVQLPEEGCAAIRAQAIVGDDCHGGFGLSQRGGRPHGQRCPDGMRRTRRRRQAGGA